MSSESSFSEKLERARDLADVFELVKSAVSTCTGRCRGGLMLGLANLGGGLDGFVGAFHPVATNIIVVNSLPLARIRETEPELFKPYAFHILLHEYVHTLGSIDEAEVKALVVKISLQAFGADHPVTDFARNLDKYIPKLVYPVFGWMPNEEYEVSLVRGFDRSSASPYIR
ncbi:MAG: hypothetical protein JSV94_03845 [Methanobacteriota archaeon]|nr:MAG: hypothetical protein JSV94_03845 [Euryarchaeota archaeon]